MALVKKQVSRQRMIVFGIILAVLILTALYYYFGGTSGSLGNPGADPAIQALQSNLREVRSTDESLLTDLDRLFRDVRFQELRQYGDVPVDVGRMGRPNPFEPL